MKTCFLHTFFKCTHYVTKHDVDVKPISNGTRFPNYFWLEVSFQISPANVKFLSSNTDSLQLFQNFDNFREKNSERSLSRAIKLSMKQHTALIFGVDSGAGISITVLLLHGQGCDRFYTPNWHIWDGADKQHKNNRKTFAHLDNEDEHSEGRTI